MKKITIGTLNDRLAISHAAFCINQLEQKRLEAKLTVFELTSNNSASEHLEAALFSGDLDLALQPLDSLPTSQPEGLAITAVSRRFDPSEWLLIHTSHMADNQLFKLKTGAEVGVATSIQKAQLASFRPDLKSFQLHENLPAALENLRLGNVGALVIPASKLHDSEDISDFHVVKFNPIEFMPRPGQGVLAFRCCEDDVESRRIARWLHHPEVAKVTNVERKVLKLLGGAADLPLGAYCRLDNQGNYHVHAVMEAADGQPLRRAKISQSTSYQLAEKVVETLGAATVHT